MHLRPGKQSVWLTHGVLVFALQSVIVLPGPVSHLKSINIKKLINDNDDNNDNDNDNND